MYQIELMERMHKEIDNNQNTENNRLKSKFKKIPSGHFSVDDIEFDDPEYLQYYNKQEILSKQMQETSKENKFQPKAKFNDEPDHEEQNNEYQKKNEDIEDYSTENENDESLKDLWEEQLEILFSQLNKKSIDSKIFEIKLKKIIDSLDPSRNEKNIERIFMFTKSLVQHYQSIFFFKSSRKNDNINYTIDIKSIQIISNQIYCLTHKYGNRSTRKESSLYIEMFKDILKKYNEDHIKLKSNEKKFPSLSKVLT